MIDLHNTIYFRISVETWNFFKSSLPVQDNDRYWASVLAEGERISKEYEDTAQSQFARDQIFAVVNELERVRKAGSFDSLQSGTGKTKI